MKRMLFLTALCGTLTLSGACTQFPDLDRTLTPELQASDYPALVPLAPVLASAQATGVEPERATARIDGRVAALKARAERLRGSVLTGRERQRLERGLQ